MDIARPDLARKRKRRRLYLLFIVVVAVVLITLGVSRLKPAPPGVDSSTVWVDVVKRGSMVRQARGLGTLVPIEIQFIPAMTDGRVVRKLVEPGTQVTPSTVLVDLSNPELEQAVFNAQYQLKGAEADYQKLEAEQRSAVLDRKASAAGAQADYAVARTQAQTDAELSAKGLVSQLDAEQSREKAAALQQRAEAEQQRYQESLHSETSELAAQATTVEEARALLALKQSQLDQLHVRAGIAGVLQELPVEDGQQVTAGTTLAKVVQPTKLKAELKIPETQARDIALNQPASVDTHNGIIPGHVMRIDPAAVNGTVTVDVALDGALPPGARPDLSVEGTIDLERLSDVLYVGRPAFGQENSTIGMFRLENPPPQCPPACAGASADLVQVKVGRSSVNTIEILGGLREGDRVVLSDISQQAGNSTRVRLD
jgi:HlyD family secretion protein